MTGTMEPTFAGALRKELLTRARTGRARRGRWLAIGAGAAVAVGIPAAAGAYQLLQPGVNEVELSAPVVVTHTGAADVDLGDRPADATHVQLSFTCLTAGHAAFVDGASVTCAAGETTGYTMALLPGVESVHIGASAGLTWQLTASYQLRVVEPFATNANGDSYGVPNEVHGDPDLILVEATNGELGYVYAEDLENAFGPQPTSPEEAVAYNERVEGQTALVPVYESDGETQLGEFQVG